MPYWELLKVPRKHLDTYLEMIEIEDQIKAARMQQPPNMA